MSIQNIKFSKEFANNLERIHRLTGFLPRLIPDKVLEHIVRNCFAGVPARAKISVKKTLA